MQPSSNHPSLHESPETLPNPPIYSHAQALLPTPPTAMVIATFAFASSPAIVRESMALPPHLSGESITWRLRELLGPKTIDKLDAVVDSGKVIMYPCFVTLAAPHLRNTGTLLVTATLDCFLSYGPGMFSSWDVNYNPVSGKGRIAVWWVTSEKEERKLLRGHITEMYAPVHVREVERNRVEKKLPRKIGRFFGGI